MVCPTFVVIQSQNPERIKRKRGSADGQCIRRLTVRFGDSLSPFVVRCFLRGQAVPEPHNAPNPTDILRMHRRTAPTR